MRAVRSVLEGALLSFLAAACGGASTPAPTGPEPAPLLAPVAPARRVSVNELPGAWRGEVQEQASGPYSIEATIGIPISFEVLGQNVAEVEYPDQKCHGTWRLDEIRSDRVVLRERIEYGRNKCADDGIVFLIFDADSLRFEWHFPNGDYVASARLERSAEGAGASTGRLSLSKRVAAGELEGVWIGAVREEGATSYTMEVTVKKPITDKMIDKDVAEIEYPDQKCGGTWRLKEIRDDRVVLIERIKRGKKVCADGGTVFLIFDNESLRFEWFYPNGDYAASSRLLKKAPTPAKAKP